MLPLEVVDALSREFALACDAAGNVLWADARAVALFGVTKGDELPLAPGSTGKGRRLLEEARQHTVSGWELVLSRGGKPCTVAFSGSPIAEGVALVGSLIPDDYGGALERQHQSMSELASLHRELQTRTRELERVTRDLGDVEKGVQVLNQELDEQSQNLMANANVRAKVLASHSHELRTPINAVLGLSELLLTNADGPLTDEQRKQVGFIRRAAETLWTLVNDLLDASRLDARGAPLRISKCDVDGVFQGLRGMLRPIAVSSGVQLSIEEPAKPLALETDEGKIGQILRNLVSNALKFTEKGEVRVWVEETDFGAVHFHVRDTGIGIGRDDVAKLFRDFSQIDGRVQRRSVGTGLGLSLSKRLAHLLGGDVSVETAEGKGSTFTLTVPVVHPDAVEMRLLDERSRKVDPARVPVLVVEDDRATLLLYERYLVKHGFQIVPARSVEDARRRLATLRPAAIVLDVMLEDDSTWSLLHELKADARTRDIPVMVLTVIGAEDRARSLGADEFALKPVDEQWLSQRLGALALRSPVRRVLVIDDDESARYLVRRHLAGTGYFVSEAGTAAAGIEAARNEKPDLVLLDFFLPDATAIDVLDELRRDEKTRNLPVIVLSAQQLSANDRSRLEAATRGVLSKAGFSREEALARIRDALSQRGVTRA